MLTGKFLWSVLGVLLLCAVSVFFLWKPQAPVVVSAVSVEKGIAVEVVYCRWRFLLRSSMASARQRQEKALSVLDELGVARHAGKKPNQLSGGERQRVAVARAGQRSGRYSCRRTHGKPRYPEQPNRA